jgi:glycosyltransferase involved in cell wall biosynthesis
MSRRRTVFLACPYGPVGGGMGSIMAYLAARGTDPSGRFRFKRLETRGAGPIALSPLFLAAAIVRIIAEAALGRLAVVHLNLAERGSMYRKAALLAVAKLVRAPTLLHLHAAQLIQCHAAMGPAGKALLRWMVRSADHCVVLGELWQTWLTGTFQVDPNRISIVRNGVPPTPKQTRTVQPDTGFHLLFVGNLLHRKGINDLLHAVALQTRAIHLTLAGGGPIETWRAIATQLGIADRVSFTGWVSQDAVRTLMVNADALILPAYHEALPLVILEALTSATPVICTPIGAIPEVLVDTETALFVTPGDTAGIANAITTLIDQPALGRRLAANGATLYRRLFTIDAFAARIGLLYATLQEARRDRQR